MALLHSANGEGPKYVCTIGSPTHPAAVWCLLVVINFYVCDVEAEHQQLNFLSTMPSFRLVEKSSPCHLATKPHRWSGVVARSNKFFRITFRIKQN